MDDTSAPVRDAAAEALGTLLKLLGERAMGPFVDQLDKIKMDKVLLTQVILNHITLSVSTKTLATLKGQSHRF
jgi:hypothetical protein